MSLKFQRDQLRNGDILHCRGTSLISRAIERVINDGSHDALAIQRARDEEEALALPEVQRARLLSVLSARKRGPVPLEQHRAGLLFLLERRAIRLIETGKSV